MSLNVILGFKSVFFDCVFQSTTAFVEIPVASSTVSANETPSMESYTLIITIIIILYYVIRPISKNEKNNFDNKSNWRGGF